MTVRIVVECDGNGCSNELAMCHDGEDSLEGDGWSVDYENGFHYCPTCKKAMIASGELEEG